MKKNKKYALTAAALALTAIHAMTSFAADGTWTLTDAGYTFTYSDGRAARGTWEDLDGEWYHFDQNGIMEDGMENGRKHPLPLIRMVPSRRAGSTMVRAAETGTIMILREMR